MKQPDDRDEQRAEAGVDGEHVHVPVDVLLLLGVFSLRQYVQEELEGKTDHEEGKGKEQVQPDPGDASNLALPHGMVFGLVWRGVVVGEGVQEDEGEGRGKRRGRCSAPPRAL